jgi:DNA repair and recombination protein RAD54B
VKKVLVVCPVTIITVIRWDVELTQNWKQEFKKWLGNERIGVLTVTSDADLRSFTYARTYQILLINYEKVVKISDELNKLSIDLIICDEGHRLKTQQNKSLKALQQLHSKRRILITGTPVQNDLSEFYTMADFVNPGLLDSYASFKKVYETPIMKSRQPHAPRKTVELGRARSDALSELTRQFVLRRTSEILAKYLAPKCSLLTCGLT